MKLKLLIIILILTFKSGFCSTTKIHLEAPAELQISLESNAQDQYFIKDEKKKYLLGTMQEFILEGAYILKNLGKSSKFALILGFKTVGRSRDLSLRVFELQLSSENSLKLDPVEIELIKNQVFDAGRMTFEEGNLAIEEELRAYGSSYHKRKGEMLPLLKKYSVRFNETLQISIPKWPIPSTALDYFNLAHAMMINAQHKKAATLYLLGLQNQSRQLRVLETSIRNQVQYDLAFNLEKIGNLAHAKTILKSLGPKLPRKSTLRTPVFKLYQKVLKQLGED